MSTVSPLAPDIPSALADVAGVSLASAEAGVRYTGRTDLMLAVFEPGTAVAGVLTQSACASAPVEWCRERLDRGTARALVVNSGNANAFTGRKGELSVTAIADSTASAVGCEPDDVMLASTGVIGEPLDPASITATLGTLSTSAGPGGWLDAARAIMTTDTYPKLTSRKAQIDGREVTINGLAKGSGMIAPDMATMLSFVFTDASIAPNVLRTLLRRAADRSFNCITVDGDTSTSDTLMIFATGAAGGDPVTDTNDRRLRDFERALNDILLDLALQVVRDGEGASKLVSVTVTGARSRQSARKIGLSIANSPLVKTAIAGEDANWGRVVMAVGKAGEPAERDRLAIWFGDTRVAVDGEIDPEYEEPVVADYMKGDEIDLTVDIGIGRGKATVWTCDFTHGYISINADYRS